MQSVVLFVLFVPYNLRQQGVVIILNDAMTLVNEIIEEDIMSFSEQLWFAWSWIGLGMAMLMLVLLLCTDFLHDASGSRWRDVSWYAWLPMPAYLFHQFEEYACHITNGQFDIVAQFYVPGNMPFSTDGLPLLHFPLVNIGLAWFGAPLAAMLCRRNPVIGCSYFGFMFLNGMTHIVMGGSPAENPGLTTGAFLFVPSALWMLYMTSKEL